MKLSRSSRFPEKRVGGLILSSFVSLELDGAIGNCRAFLLSSMCRLSFFRVSFKKGKLVDGTDRSFSGFPKFCSEFW